MHICKFALEYSCHIQPSACTIYLELLDKIIKKELLISLVSSSHLHTAVRLLLWAFPTLTFMAITMVPIFYEFNRNARLASGFHLFTVELGRCSHNSMLTVSIHAVLTGGTPFRLQLCFSCLAAVIVLSRWRSSFLTFYLKQVK